DPLALAKGFDKNTGLTVAREEIADLGPQRGRHRRRRERRALSQIVRVLGRRRQRHPAIRQAAEVVTTQPSDAGVVEVIAKLMTGELCPSKIIALGQEAQTSDVYSHSASCRRRRNTGQWPL